MKYCKDCRFYTWRGNCRSPGVPLDYDPETGPYVPTRVAIALRINENACGIAARFYEPWPPRSPRSMALLIISPERLMSDLLARLKMRPPRETEHWRNEFDRDLALDALAEVLDHYAVIAECPDYGPPPEHYTTARTILRELRGATSSADAARK